MSNGNIDRRDFLKGAAATVALLLTAEQVLAAEAGEESPVKGPPVRIAVIGLGLWGKEILTSLTLLPSAQVTAVCDTYEPYVKKALEIAPNAAPFSDYRQVLASPEVEAVVLATPTHLHKDIALEAMQAGKHVYVEAPLAGSIDDAKAIALAGLGSGKVFQGGLQNRSNPLYKHVLQFARAGVLGNPAQVMAQSNNKLSWRRMAPTPERESELNWRLGKATSIGLPGELGVHRFDMASWFLNGLPRSVSGFGSITAWNDGRDVPDTVQCVLEYANGVNMVFSSTLASSFSNTYILFQGSNNSLLLREKRGWMIKEDDAPLLGWEVYARKEPTMDESGICLVADATKLIAAGKEPGHEAESATAKEAIYFALENFTRSIREDLKSSCGPIESYQSAVVAIKANEAVNSGGKIDFLSEWFELQQ